MKRRQILNLTIIGFAALAFVASAASADWLITRDGSRIETKGPFKVEGKRVIFTLPNGTLGALPASEVDLEATEALAEEAARVDEPPTETPKRKAVMVITDADVGHPNLNRTPVPDGEDPEDGGQTLPAPALEVTNWQENVDLASTSVWILGTLANPTENPATAIAMDVMLFDEDGGLLERRPARLERGFLNPGTSTRFEAQFNDTLSYDSIDFEIRSRGFLANPPDDEPSSDDEDESGDDDFEDEDDLQDGFDD